MGEAGRRAFWRSGTKKSRIDNGIRFHLESLQRYIEKIPVPADATDEEKALIRFKALRKASQR